MFAALNYLCSAKSGPNDRLHCFYYRWTVRENYAQYRNTQLQRTSKIVRFVQCLIICAITLILNCLELLMSFHFCTGPAFLTSPHRCYPSLLNQVPNLLCNPIEIDTKFVTTEVESDHSFYSGSLPYMSGRLVMDISFTRFQILCSNSKPEFQPSLPSLRDQWQACLIQRRIRWLANTNHCIEQIIIRIKHNANQSLFGMFYTFCFYRSSGLCGVSQRDWLTSPFISESADILNEYLYVFPIIHRGYCCPESHMRRALCAYRCANARRTSAIRSPTSGRRSTRGRTDVMSCSSQSRTRRTRLFRLDR